MVSSTSKYLDISDRPSCLKEAINDKFKHVCAKEEQWGYNGQVDNYMFAPEIGTGKNFA
jgi:hypothetical protein